MTTLTISAEYEFSGTIRCAHDWDHIATHIELSHTHEHEPDEHIVVCGECARLAGLLACESCAGETTIPVEAGRTRGALIPIYAPRELAEGRCRWHLEDRPETAVKTSVPAATRQTGCSI